MTAYKTSPYQMQTQADSPSIQLSAEQLEKLHEIHELINLAIAELPMMAQYHSMPALPTMPYSYSFFQFPWG